MKVQDALNLLNLQGESFTQKEIKKAYKAASIKYHPDKNAAGLEMMKAINEAFDLLKKLGDTVTSDSDAQSYDYAEELNDILNALMALDGLDLEVCGNWVWIGGNTKEHKETLKELGCRWGNKKKLWFYRPVDYKKVSGREYSMTEIRDMHGSQILRKYQRPELAA